MSLPPAGTNQAYCDVSALEAGLIRLPLAHFTTSAAPEDVSIAPSLAFLLQNSTTRDKFVFDLGIRKDWENLPPRTLEIIKALCDVDIPQDVVQSLAKGGASPSDISTVCLSHVHFDHTGDPSLFPESTFLVGDESRHLKSAVSSEDPDPVVVNHLLPPERTKYLSSLDWQPLGPFPRALDYYGDGSLYIVDAAGHLPGHINVFARTSADGAWIYLAGDSAHHWDLITGKGDIAVSKGVGFSRCAHQNKEAAEQHNLRIRKLLEIPRVRVLLAHDEPWYEVNRGGSAFWPGKIKSL
ncbi:hypothetical protein DXG03_008770 [Asterophora parasitica]|uniref:Metallo-beta-lactamase domain-containing protein n=1 Tax=Asterophora parasitica TaxID=117018 RepID=A0A9P7G7D8_9AGAR|nr:hypothetical protein DXG03_008770 [Asterophora parasitica]